MLGYINGLGRRLGPVAFGLTTISIILFCAVLDYVNLRLADSALLAGEPVFKSTWWLVSLGTIVGVILFLGAFSGVFQAKKTRKPSSERPKATEKSEVAIVVVHGMGVQDRYGMLTDFGDGLKTYARDYFVEELYKEGLPSNSRTFRLRPEDGQTDSTVDLREVYWGHLFNGVTNWRSAMWFGLMTVKTFLSTLLSRFWKKRIAELAWVVLATGLLSGLIFGIYGAFRLGALRVERILRPPTEIVLPDLDRRDELGLLIDDNYALYKSTGIEHKLPLSGRISEVQIFIAYSYGTLYDDLKKSVTGVRPEHSVWITKDQWLTMVGDVSLLQYAFAFLHAFAFFKLWSIVAKVLGQGAKALSHDRKQVLRDGSAFEGKPSAVAQDQIMQRLTRLRTERLTMIRSAFWPGFAALIGYLLLDPYLNMLLVPFLFSTGLLVVIARGLTSWFEDFLGDVQIYVTSNENSRFFTRREAATQLVANEIQAVLDMHYQQVIVVAHSLGSAVTLNAIRRLSGYSAQSETFVELPKLKAFITIGSPLRKIRQLFNTKKSKWDYGQHNQKGDLNIFMGHRVRGKGIPWFNYWYTSDLFADRLAYTDRSQRASTPESFRHTSDLDTSGFPVGAFRDLKLGKGSLIWSHSDYWLDDQFVDTLFDIALCPDARQVDITAQSGEIQLARDAVQPSGEAAVRMQVSTSLL